MSGSVLLTSWEEQEEKLEGAFRVIKISSGDPHTRAIFGAVVDRYNVVADRPRPTLEDLTALVGEKVTLVTHGDNFMGGGLAKAEEGKLFLSSRGGGALGILPKGKRTQGLRVTPENVLDVFPGYATADATEMMRKVRSAFPTLKALTQDRLLELPPSSNTLDLCLFGTYRMPDGQQSDAIVLAGEYSGEEDDIVDGGVCLLRPEVGISEHGSFYGRDLLGLHVLGEVVGYQPISFAEGLALCELPFEAAYERLLGNCVAVA